MLPPAPPVALGGSAEELGVGMRPWGLAQGSSPPSSQEARGHRLDRPVIRKLRHKEIKRCKRTEPEASSPGPPSNPPGKQAVLHCGVPGTLQSEEVNSVGTQAGPCPCQRSRRTR